MKARNVYAIIRTEAAARDAVAALRADGFADGRISLLAREGGRSPELHPGGATGAALRAPEGIAVRAASGMVAGSFLGLGMSEIEAREYQEAAVRGDIVLAVRVESIDEQARAARILAGHEARGITTTPLENHAA